MNQHALSPVVASIILIAVTVAVSIAVAAWMGAPTFHPFDSINYVAEIPSFQNATHATYWLGYPGDPVWGGRQTYAQANKVKLPYNFTIWIRGNRTLTLDITYFICTNVSSTDGINVYSYQQIGHETYQIDFGGS